MRALRVWAGLCLTGALFAQPAGRGVISGIVVEATSGEPVRKAIVTVTWHGTPRSWATLRTDSGGRFRFEGLPAGAYDLRANKAQLGSANYGANSSRESGETITLGDGETRDGLKLRFFHSATVTGHVFGPDSEPLRTQQIMLLRSSRNLGERVLVSYRQTTADDRGEYTITDIEPGQYYLYTAGRPFMQPMEEAAATEIIVDQFLGGTREAKNATLLSLHDGDFLKGLDFHLTAEPAIRVKGRVVGMPAPATPSADKPVTTPPGVRVTRPPRIMGPLVQLSLSPISEVNQGMFFRGGQSAGAPNYEFTLQPAPPGRYRLNATSTIDGKTYTASESIELHPGMGEISLTLSPPVEIKGHLRVEGDPGKIKFQIQLTRRNNNGMGGAGNAKVADDGSFTFASVGPGEVALNINNLPREAYLKSMRFGDEDVLYKRFEIRSGPQPSLEIVISMHSAKITGTVEANGGDPARAGVILEPTGALHELARYYYGATADEHGKFEFPVVAPGKYKIFAVEKLAPAGFRSVEGAESLEDADPDSAAFGVAEDGKLELHPKLIPFERARAILQ